MAPFQDIDDRSVQGFWGNITSTLDWCEQNYEISFYIAEFWNTISNLGIVIPGLLGSWVCWKDNIERRFILSFLSLAVVGLGSWCFHMTLQYSMQLADEVPMMWTSLVVLYCSLEVMTVGKPNLLLVLGLTFYGVSSTLIYVFLRHPIIFQITYGLAVLAMIFIDFTHSKRKGNNANLFWWACGLMVFGFFLWNLDNQMCSSLQLGRNQMPISFRPLTQLHAWWHVLAGYSTYLHILFCVHARCQILKRKSRLEVSWVGLTLRCQEVDKSA